MGVAMNPDFSVHFSSPSSSDDIKMERFTIERMEYLDFVSKFLEQNRDLLPRLSADAIVTAYEYRGTKMREWTGSNAIEAEKIAEYALRKMQMLSVNTVEEEFLCSTLENSDQNPDAEYVKQMTEVIQSLKFDFGELESFYVPLRSELEARRFLNGEPSVCDPVLMPVKKDIRGWLSSRIRYHFPSSTEWGYQILVEPCSGEALSGISTAKIQVESTEDKKTLFFRPRFLMKISDSQGSLLTFKFMLEISSAFEGNPRKVCYRCKTTPIAIWKHPSRSFTIAAHCMRQLYEDFSNRQVLIKRLYRMRKTLIQNDALVRLDLSRIQIGSSEERSKKKSALARSFKTPRKLSPSSLTSSAAVFLDKVSSSSSRTPVPKARSARELKSAQLNKEALSKASSFHRTIKQWKGPTREDFSNDAEQLIPPMLAFLNRSCPEKNVKSFLHERLLEYRKTFGDETFQRLVSNETNRIKEYVPLSKSIHDFVKSYRYREEESQPLNRMHQYSGKELLENAEFFYTLTSPDTYRRFLGKHRKIPADRKVGMQLKAVFHKLYESGFVEEEYKKRGRHRKEHIGWLSEFRAKQMLADCLEPIQKFLYPLILGSEWIEQTFSKQFPFLQQKMSSEYSETSTCDEEQAETTRIKAAFQCQNDIHVKRTSRRVKIEKKYRVSLHRGDEKLKFAELTIADRMELKVKNEIWKRAFYIKKVDFLEGAPLDLCQFVADYLISKSNYTNISPLG